MKKIIRYCVDCGNIKSKSGPRCKKCGYKHRIRPKGLNYKITNINKGWFKKGHEVIGLREELSPRWKGDKVGYDGIHSWIETKLGKPRICEFCKTTKAKIYQWSNKSGLYKRDILDWQRLCVKCHCRYDFEKFGARKEFYI